MIRVVIVAGARLYRDGLERLLGSAASVMVVATAGTSELGVSIAHSHGADVVLFELSLAGSAVAVRALRDLKPSIPVVALSVPETEMAVITCAEAGVLGLVTHEGSIEDVVAAIESAARWETVCSPRAAAILLGRIHKLARGHAVHAAPLPRLTSREREIVELIDQGLSNKEIATRLCIELPTVKNHVHHILEKLQISRRIDVGPRLRATGDGATSARH